MSEPLGQHYLADALQTFRDYKRLAEQAFAQIGDEDFFQTIDQETNSIAVNMKHMAGNMISSWSDFLTTDGEKPERDRDIEFVMLPGVTREEMIAYWEKGWQSVFDAISTLQPEDLMRTITIRGQKHTVVQAIDRQLAHYAYHTGQIVFLAKHFKSLAKPFTSNAWQSLSVPRNKSAEFNAYLEQKMSESSDTPREGRLEEVMEFAKSKRD
jgi:hypothetical protein